MKPIYEGKHYALEFDSDPPFGEGFCRFGTFPVCFSFCFLFVWYHAMGGEKMIAIVVRAIRRQKGWDRKQMAKILGVSAAYIGRVERGEQKLDEKMWRNG